MKTELIREKLSRILQSELTRLGITVTELARRAELRQSTVYEWTSGKTEPSFSKLIALESALGRKAGWICREIEKGRPSKESK